MESMPALSGLWSSVTSLITCTREPKANTSARCPGRKPPTTDFAACLASVSRPPARMLSELSMASTVTSPWRDALAVCRT